MMNLRSLTMVLPLLLAGCGAGEAPTRPAKPTPAAKSNANLEAFQRAEAIRSLGKGSPDAVPILVKALSDQHNLVRTAAIETLGQLGHAASDAAPELIPFLDNDAYRPQTIKALVKIGPGAVPVVAKALKDTRLKVRAGAADTLGQIGPFAQPALLDLLPALDDPEPPVRRAVAEALGKLGVGTEPVKAALTKHLIDEDPPTRFNAAEALVKLDPKHQATLDTLVKNLTGTDEEVRLRAIQALARLGPGAKGAWNALSKSLTDDPAMPVRALAARAAARIDPQAAVPLLIKALGDPDQQVRNAAAEALGEIGPDARDALPALKEAMQPLNGREAAYQAIKKIEAPGSK